MLSKQRGGRLNDGKAEARRWAIAEFRRRAIADEIALLGQERYDRWQAMRAAGQVAEVKAEQEAFVALYISTLPSERAEA